MDLIMERQAVEAEIKKAIPKELSQNTPELIEAVNVLVDNIYSEEMNDLPDHKIKIAIERPHFLESKSVYPAFGLNIIASDPWEKFIDNTYYYLFCKVDQGTLLRDKDGHPILDPVKVGNIKNKYLTQWGIYSPIDKLVAAYKNKFIEKARDEEWMAVAMGQNDHIQLNTREKTMLFPEQFASNLYDLLLKERDNEHFTVTDKCNIYLALHWRDIEKMKEKYSENIEAINEPDTAEEDADHDLASGTENSPLEKFLKPVNGDEKRNVGTANNPGRETPIRSLPRRSQPRPRP
jgi:hypothetical protein